MSAMNDYLEVAFLNHFLRNVSTTAPAAVYVGLFTADPTDTGTGSTELTGNAYARQQATFAAPVSPGGTCTTSADMTFPQATGSWGTVSHFGIFDASSGGNMLFYGAWTTPKTIATGDVFKVSAGSLTVTAA